MDSFRVAITGDRQAGLRLDAFPQNAYEALRAEIEPLTAELAARIESAMPSKSGRLRSEVRSAVYTDAQRIKGYVTVAADSSADHGKAAALEYGAHRPTHVKAHSMRLDHAWDKMLAAPMTVMVAAYDRTPDIAAHAFERGPLAEMSAEIVSRMAEAVDRAVAEANA